MTAGVTIDAVWDDAVRALRRRAGPVTAVALLAFAVPAAVQAALRAFPVLGPAPTALLALLVSVAGVVLSLWGGLAIIALCAESAPSPAAARRAAGRRLPASIGIAALLLLALVAASLPLGVAAAMAGTDMAALSRGGVPGLPAGAGRGLALFGLLVIATGLWIGARLLPVQAVVLHERRGARAIVAAFSSTRGLALRLIGAELVFVVVALVSALAVQGAFGTMFVLLLGPARLGWALVAAGCAGALASAALTAVALAFVARLYEALAAIGRVGRSAPAAPVPAPA